MYDIFCRKSMAKVRHPCRKGVLRMDKFFKHPWVIVGVIAAITVFFAAQLPKAQMDNNIMSFLPDGNPAKVTQRHFEEEYGDSTMVSVGLEKPYGTVFERDFLARVREYSDAVESIPLVKSINSILSTQYITSDSESIIVTDLVGEDFTGTPEEIAELKRRINSWDMYQGALVSEDLSSTQIIVNLDVASERSGEPEVMAALTNIREMAKETFARCAAVYTAGQAVVSATLTESALADVMYLIPVVVAVLLTVLILSFRRFSYVTLPLLTVFVATILGVGAAPLFGIKLTLLVIVLPVILIAVGSAYGIHVISHYKDEIESKTFTVSEHREFVLSLVRKLIKPVSLAALTTFVGFISFCFAPMTSMRSFGILASFGVLAAVAVALTLIPAILLIRGPRAVKIAAAKKTQSKTPRFNFANELAGTLTAIARKKALVLAVTALVIAVSLIGASKVIIDSSMVEFFNPKSEVNRSDKFIREHFGGSTQIIVSVEADNTETLLSPDVLSAIDGLSAYLTERVPRVGKVTGFTDMIKRMNQMFNVDESPDGITAKAVATSNDTDSDFGFGDFGGFDNEDFTEAPYTEDAAVSPKTPPALSDTPLTFAQIASAAGKRANMSANDLVRELERLTNYEGYSYYEIPSDPARYGKQSSDELQRLIANYLVLAGGDSEESMSNDPLEPTAVETIVLVNSQRQKDADLVMDAINEYVAANFPPTVKVLVGGGAAQMGAMTSLITSSQIISIIVAVLTVLVIIALSNKSLAAGLIAALPLSIAILANFALMGFTGITLNFATVMIASLAVGIGIDYTIHFMETFKLEYENGGDYLLRTFTTSGKAILINAVSVGASFAVLVFSNFDIIAQFGGLVALSMVVSAIVSLTVIPVLLTTVKPKFIFWNVSASC
jgi:predicted RND superfamily exporter protein